MDHPRAGRSSEAMTGKRDKVSAVVRQPVVKDPQEDRYIHLVRLAWDLRLLGAETTVELPRTGEPRVVMPRTVGDLRVFALMRGGRWLFSWGRSQWIDALDERAAQRIHEAAR